MECACGGVFAVNIGRKAIFIHPLSDFSVNHKIVQLGITIAVHLLFQREGTDAKRQTEVNNRLENGLSFAD